MPPKNPNSIMALIIRSSPSSQKIVFNEFLKLYPLFIPSINAHIYDTARQMMDTALANGDIGQGFYDFLIECTTETP